MDERNDTERIGDLEAWAFRAGRDLAEIKTQLKAKSTVAAVDALHQDVRELREAMTEGFDHLNARLDGVNGRLDGVDGQLDGLSSDVASVKTELTAQRRLLEAILERVGGGPSV